MWQNVGLCRCIWYLIKEFLGIIRTDRNSVRMWDLKTWEIRIFLLRIRLCFVKLYQAALLARSFNQPALICQQLTTNDAYMAAAIINTWHITNNANVVSAAIKVLTELSPFWEHVFCIWYCDSSSWVISDNIRFRYTVGEIGTNVLALNHQTWK